MIADDFVYMTLKIMYNKVTPDTYAAPSESTKGEMGWRKGHLV